MIAYNQEPISKIQTQNRLIPSFLAKRETMNIGNIDAQTVEAFGEEWAKFHDFDETEIQGMGAQYFDVVTQFMLSANSVVLDVGCGSGRWTKYIHNKCRWAVALDPSKAILAADHLLSGVANVQLLQAEIDNIPFEDESFDFVFCLGVLHHMPDTAAGLKKCVAKLKKGGHFLVYIYYDLSNRSQAFRFLFSLVNGLRRIVAPLPSTPKKWICDLIALLIYWPLASINQLLRKIGLPTHLIDRLPLSYYADKSFFIMRNDALDRFGTPLEKRFSKQQIQTMMESAGLEDICFSPNAPFWHAVGRKG